MAGFFHISPVMESECAQPYRMARIPCKIAPSFLLPGRLTMRVSQFFISTLKEAPSEAELPSHKLMLRAGYIKKLASGLYTWMPLGLRVLRKVENAVREEMDKSGGVELLMPDRKSTRLNSSHSQISYA